MEARFRLKGSSVWQHLQAFPFVAVASDSRLAQRALGESVDTGAGGLFICLVTSEDLGVARSVERRAR